MFHKGSGSGPDYFCWYASTLSEVISQQVNLNAFADDCMVYNSFKPDIEHLEHKCIEELDGCLLDIYKWMNENRLKVSPMKMEFIKFGSKQQLKKCSSDSIKVVDEVIYCVLLIRLPGSWLDSQLLFKIYTTKEVYHHNVELAKKYAN